MPRFRRVARDFLANEESEISEVIWPAMFESLGDNENTGASRLR
jgi:hypothetical protein